MLNDDLLMSISGKCTGAMNWKREQIQKEGMHALWKGFPPYFLQIRLYTIRTFLSFNRKIKCVH